MHKLTIPFGPLLPTALYLAHAPGLLQIFAASFCATEIMSQEIHKWSHSLPRETPALVNALQDRGVLLARKPHARHHSEPFEGNYCIVSGYCNPALDGSGFFRVLERIVYAINGQEPNSWKLDAGLRERTLAGDYRLVK